MVVSWTILQAEKTAARLLKPKEGLHFAPLCFYFRASLQAARIDFHAGPAKRADRRQELPRERAMASGRLRKGGRDEIFSLALGETQAGLGREQIGRASGREKRVD